MAVHSGVFDVVSAYGTAGGQQADTLPLRLEMAPSTSRTVARSLLVAFTLAALAVPAVLATLLLERLGPLQLVADSPLTWLALALQPVLWIALAGLALSCILPRVGRRRRVIVRSYEVRIADRAFPRLAMRRVPLRSFRGIAHAVRTTLGSSHQEIVLMHANPDWSVPLVLAPTIAQSEVDRLARLLALPVLPAREVYRIERPAFIGVLRPKAAAT
jgi:hypothetical protein